jgi:vacuolar-type H+-ATPase subunit E/Vma4
MNAGQLDSLLQSIEAERQKRLEKIAAEERQAADLLRQKAGARLTQEERTLRERHARQIDALRKSALFSAEKTERRRIWRCQRDCVEQVKAAVRQALESKQAARQWLSEWIARARNALPASDAIILETDPGWARHVPKDSDVELRKTPMLGGARLVDEKHGIVIDGDWQRRLDDLTPELWRRWYERTGEHHED